MSDDSTKYYVFHTIDEGVQIRPRKGFFKLKKETAKEDLQSMSEGS